MTNKLFLKLNVMPSSDNGLTEKGGLLLVAIKKICDVQCKFCKIDGEVIESTIIVLEKKTGNIAYEIFDTCDNIFNNTSDCGCEEAGTGTEIELPENTLTFDCCVVTLEGCIVTV